MMDLLLPIIDSRLCGLADGGVENTFDVFCKNWANFSVSMGLREFSFAIVGKLVIALVCTDSKSYADN